MEALGIAAGKKESKDVGKEETLTRKRMKECSQLVFCCPNAFI